jgi:hypothetical protein
MNTHQDFLERAYAAFNAGDVDGALKVMHSEVVWPNGMEGGTVYGHGGVREYWRCQWTKIDPHVDPLRFTVDDQGRTVVEVHQVVRDLAGKVVSDQTVEHIYVIENELIRSMQIRKP